LNGTHELSFILRDEGDEWAVQRSSRYMTLETIGQISDDPLVSLPADQPRPMPESLEAQP
jgi:hypothetical protein